MAKNEFTLIGKIKTDEIIEGLEKIRKEASKQQLGDKLFNDLNKQLDDVEKKMKSAFSKIPGAGASEKQVKTFSNSIADIKTQLGDIATKAKGFEVTDKYLAENVDSVKSLVNELDILMAKFKEIQEKISNKPLKIIEGEGRGTGVKGAMRKTASAMKEAAGEGSREKLDEAYTSGMAAIKAKMGDSSYDQGALKDQKDALIAFYQSMIKYTNQVIQQNELVKNKNKEVTDSYQTATDEIKNGTDKVVDGLNKQVDMMGEAQKTTDEFGHTVHTLGERSKAIEQVSNRIKQMLSITSLFSVARRLIRGAIQDFQELDKEFNEIAIVSQYSTQEMWDSFSQVNQMAQEYGVTTKNILEVQNLYYHQGKQMAEVNKLTAQTLTLAKITGMDYAEATNKMTAALNAYKLEAEDAVRVTDTVAALSANAATSSEELMTALTKTASIAANAGVSLENTEVFLTKMIETTREAPENLGTAMKTILARFGEVKDAIDDTGESIEMMDVNKVGKALKTIGISLLDSAGQMRNAEDVLMELSAKWDDLDRNTQRYIATQAAGSRQQSRFIAMMENYDRTLELVDVAQNSAGTGARQLAKAQESIETHLNRLKSAWQEFYSGLIKSGMIKWFIDLGNAAIGVLNKISKIGGIGPILASTLAGFTLWGAKVLIVDGAMKKLGTTMATNLGIGVAENKNLTQEIGLRTVLTTLMAAENKEKQKEVEEDLLLVIAQKAENKEKTKGIALSALQTLSLKGLGKSIKQDIKMKLLDIGANTGLLTSEQILSAQNLGLAGTFKMLAASIWSTLGPLLAIIAAIGAFAIAWTTYYNIHSKSYKMMNDTSEQLDTLAKKQEEYNKQVEKTKSLEDNVKILNQYKDTLILTTEQQEEYNQAINNIAADYPEYIDYIDEEGQYHLKNIDILEKEIDAQKRLNKERRDDYTKYKKGLIEQGVYEEDYQGIKNLQMELENRAAKLNVTSEDEKKKSKAILKDMGYSWGDILGSRASKSTGKLATGAAAGVYGGPLGTALAYWGAMDTAFSGAYSNLEEYLEKIMSGDTTAGTTKGLFNTLLTAKGIEAQFNDKGYQKFIKEMSGKEVNSSTISEALKKIGVDDAEITDALANFLAQSPALQQLLSGQYGELSNVKKQELIYSLDDIDFKFTTSPDANARFAEAFATALPDISSEDFAKYMEGLDEDTYNKIIKNIFNAEEVTFEDLNIEDLGILANPQKLSDAIDKYLLQQGIKGEYSEAYVQFLIEKFTLTDQEKAEIESVILGDTGDISQFTQTQLNAMLKTAGSLTKIYETQDKAKTAYKNISSTLESATKSANDYSKAINALNTSDLTTTDGIRQFGKSMAGLNVDMSTAVDIVGTYNNGLENLDLENPTQLLTTLNTEQENFNKQLESLGNLTEGKGTLDDLNVALQTLMETEQGLDLITTIENVFDAITITSEGLLMDMAVIGEAGDALLEQQVTGNEFLQAVYEGTRNKAFEAARDIAVAVAKLHNVGTAALEAAADMAALKAEVAKIPGLEDWINDDTNYSQKWTEALSSYTKSDIGARMLDLSNQLSKNSKEVATTAKAAEDAAKKAEEAAKAAKEAWQGFVDYLQGLDRYSNLDAVIDDLKYKLDNLNFEISFSTNTKEIEKDLKSQINTINKQLAANIAGMQGAQANTSAIRNSILNNEQTKGFLSFDKEGNLALNYKKYNELQEKIRKAKEKDDTVTLASLEAQEKAITDLSKLYNDNRKKQRDYAKATQENVKEQENLYKELYENVKNLEDKLIEIIQKKEDKELELVKKKYDAIKEEDNKYLDSVRKMIDKERALRDQADQEQDVRDKERKLAMMKMDTSGIYADEIKALEKELKSDYRDIQDANVDRLVDQLEEENQFRAEGYDKEVYYLETQLEYKREMMTEYYDEIKSLYQNGNNGLIDFMMKNDEDYQKSSDTGKKIIAQQFEDLATSGIASMNTIKDSENEVKDALDNAKEAAGSFEDMIKEYAKTAPVENNKVITSVETLSGKYKELINILDGDGESLTQAYENLAKAVNDYAKAEEAANNASSGGGSSGGGYNPQYTGDTTSGGNKAKQPSSDYTDTLEYVKESDSKNDVLVTETGKNGYHDNKKVIQIKDKRDDKEYWIYEEDLKKGRLGTFVSARTMFFTGTPAKKTTIRNQDRVMEGKLFKERYAQGGMVDYTGPAWVDGTKTKPEAFLSAVDTENIAKLRDVLSLVFDSPNPQYPSSSISNSNATYNITVEVGSIDSDYGVDQAIEKLEKSITDASKYRNINILKKQK